MPVVVVLLERLHLRLCLRLRILLLRLRRLRLRRRGRLLRLGLRQLLRRRRSVLQQTARNARRRVVCEGGAREGGCWGSYTG